MKTIDLSFQSETSSYKIQIGKDLFRKEIFADAIKGNSVFIVSNDTVAPIYLENLKQALAEYRVHHFNLPDGEAYKTLESWQLILNEMIKVGLKRNDTVVALGGGVVGDMAGFAAATLNRGMSIIQVPTTLLSQVDSSVGGKTAVNHPQGKNLIGAFHQPSLVVADVSTLKSLPKREFLAGISEIIKAAIIKSPQFFQWLSENVSSIVAQDEDTLIEMVEVACSIKTNIVQMDALEKGVRAWLNLGHTFGHAIETSAGYGSFLHGEAVAIGICLASKLSHERGILDKYEMDKIINLIRSFSLPTTLPESMVVDELINAMSRDKKNVSDNITLILPEKVGRVMIDKNTPVNTIEQFLIRCIGEA